MGLELTIVLTLTALALVLFVTEALRPDVVAMSVLVALLLTGILTPKEGLSGFSNDATMSIASMLVLSEGLRQTGLLKRVAHQLGRLFRYHYRLALFVMMAGAALVSAFINNVAVVAIMLPVILGMCRTLKLSPSKLLIPLSYATMFGGMSTLIGTSSNLLTSTIMVSQGLEPIGMFELTGAGMIFFLFGAFYLMTVGQWLLPDRGDSEQLRMGIKEGDYRADVQLLPDHPLVGSKASHVFRVEEEGKVLGVMRNGVFLEESQEQITLQALDILRVDIDAETARELYDAEELILLPLESGQGGVFRNRGRHLDVFEVIIAPDAAIVGRTLREADFSLYHPAVVVALRRASKVEMEDLQDVEIQGGDVLLVQAPRDELRRLQRSDDFIVVSEIGAPSYKKHMTLPVLLIFAIVVIVTTLGWLPIMVMALAGVMAMILLRVLTVEEAYRAINWEVIFLIAGFIPLGIALEKTGGIELLTESLVGWLGAWGPRVVLGGFFFLVISISAIISNQAVVVLMTPLAVSTGLALGLDPRAFAVAVTFAASGSFATPVSNHINVMIYGAGNYRFTDFVKIGVPLSLLFVVMATFVLPLFWSL